MANILRWASLTPSASLKFTEPRSGPSLQPSTPAAADPNQIRVLIDKQELPFTVTSNSSASSRVPLGSCASWQAIGSRFTRCRCPKSANRLVDTSDREARYARSLAQAISRDLWQILAVLGALGLLMEWLLFGRRRTT